MTYTEQKLDTDGGRLKIIQLAMQLEQTQEALAHAYYLVTGKSPEWSDKFGINEALADIRDFLIILRTLAKKGNAAPELLEALQVAKNTVECASIDIKTGEELPWYKMAKKAIAKATGNV